MLGVGTPAWMANAENEPVGAPEASKVRQGGHSDGRTPAKPRRLKLDVGYLTHAEGSALASAGETRVLCAVSLEDRVPDFLRGSGRGWLTAEYSMLPRSTHTRGQREANRGKIKGRTHEIQRLIGRSLRAVLDLDKLGERTLYVDCDVLQADGGTRTTSINGAYVAVAQAIEALLMSGELTESPLREPVAAVSVGLVDGDVLVDLAYTEDSRAEVDANFVMTGSGGLVEVQGTAEGRTFERADLTNMLDGAWDAIRTFNATQAKALESWRKKEEAKRARVTERAAQKSSAKASAKKPSARKKSSAKASEKRAPAEKKSSAKKSAKKAAPRRKVASSKKRTSVRARK